MKIFKDLARVQDREMIYKHTPLLINITYVTLRTKEECPKTSIYTHTINIYG